MTNPEIDKHGNKIWRNEKGECHREDGPAAEYSDGSKFWYKNGKFHREDGPAFIWANGKSWCRNGKRHRIDGPAMIYSSGEEYWYVNNEEIDIKPILERLDISPDWKSWTEEEKFLVRLAIS